MTLAVRITEIVLAFLLLGAVARVMWDSHGRMSRWQIERFAGLGLFALAIVRASSIRFDVPVDWWAVGPILLGLAVSFDGVWAMRTGRDRVPDRDAGRATDRL